MNAGQLGTMITLFSYPKLFGVADNNGYGLKVYAFLKLAGSVTMVTNRPQPTYQDLQSPNTNATVGLDFRTSLFTQPNWSLQRAERESRKHFVTMETFRNFSTSSPDATTHRDPVSSELAL